MANEINSYLQHPKFQDVLKRGTQNEEQTKLAFHVYLDLLETRGYWDVNMHYSETLQLTFVSGRPSRRDPKTLFVPLDVTEEISPQQMHRFCEHITLPGHKTKGVTLAICEKDSSTTYFKISNSLIPPPPPEVSDAQKRKRAHVAQKRRDHVNSEVRSYCEARTNADQLSDTDLSNKNDENSHHSV